MRYHDANDSGPRDTAGGRDPLLDEVWDELEALPVREVGEAPDVDQAWEELSDRLGLADGTAGRRSGDRRAGAARGGRWWSPVAGRAAAVVLLAAAAASAWALGDVRHATAAGERSVVSLPGGSTVELNAGSSLRHARGFEWLPGIARSERRVVLEGEAYFDVVPDGRPFLVETASARVRVLGTAFSVRARSEEAGEVTVAVTEGEVELVPTGRTSSQAAMDSSGGTGSTLDGARPVRLRAGDAARVGSEGRATRIGGDTDHLVAWRDGAFVAVDRPLERVLADASRAFGVEIDLEAPAAADRPVTIYYGADVEIERILADLATLHDLRYRHVGSGRWALGVR